MYQPTDSGKVHGRQCHQSVLPGSQKIQKSRRLETSLEIQTAALPGVEGEAHHGGSHGELAIIQGMQTKPT